MPAFFRAHAPLKRFDPARELEARIGMFARVLVQMRMVPHDWLVVDQRRFVAHLARDIGVAGHIPIQSGAPAQTLVAAPGAGIGGTAIAFTAAGLTIEEGANV